MTVQTAVIIAAVVVVVTAVAVFATRWVKGRLEEWRQQEAARGWTFEQTMEGGFGVRRWTGTTDGVAWIAEGLNRLRMSHGGVPGDGSGGREIVIGRWRTSARPGPRSPILCVGVPIDADTTSASMPQGDGWFARIARKAAGAAFDQVLDVYFGVEVGKDIDAAALRPVSGAAIRGFIVMAADPDDASRLLSQGLAGTLAEAVHGPRSILSDEKRPWVLLSEHGVALARMEAVRSIEELDRFVFAGLALTRATRSSA